jgi:hypothetical protein
VRVEVTRSAWKAWLAGVIAIPLLLVAIDLAFTHRYFREPARDENGNLTTQGLSEQRADYVWFIGLTAGGGVLIVWSLRDLAGSRRALVADDEGLYLPVGSTRSSQVFVPWAQVTSVRSTFVEDDATGPTPYLDLGIAGPSWVPAEPRGARWVDDHLYVDATDWQTPVHEVAGLLQTMLERSRYDDEEATA